VKHHIRRGDIVVAISGESAGTGKHGKVLQVLPRQNRAIVEGFNYVKKHVRPTQDNPQGGIVEKEAPVHLSNLKLYERGEVKTKTPRKGPDDAAGTADA